MWRAMYGVALPLALFLPFSHGNPRVLLPFRTVKLVEHQLAPVQAQSARAAAMRPAAVLVAVVAVVAAVAAVAVREVVAVASLLPLRPSAHPHPTVCLLRVYVACEPCRRPTSC